MLNSLVLVVDRYGENLLCLVLTNNEVFEELKNFYWLWKFIQREFAGFCKFLFDDLIAQINALVTDIYARACDEFLDLLLRFSTERAF